jgi:hypothetical protein
LANPLRGAIDRAIRLGAAPVLEGVKAANLLCFSRHGVPLDRAWDEHGAAVSGALELAHRVLHRSPTSTQVLFYRPTHRDAMLRDPARCRFLASLGYETGTEPDCLFEEFCSRCRGGVPHEVGCFLDYPVADVKGFIEHRGKGGLFVGWWRVYADPAGARRQFQAIHRARQTQLAVLAGSAAAS